MTRYILAMGRASKTESHEVILACLDRYGLTSTAALTAEQAARFCRERGIRV